MRFTTFLIIAVVVIVVLQLTGKIILTANVDGGALPSWHGRVSISLWIP